MNNFVYYPITDIDKIKSTYEIIKEINTKRFIKNLLLFPILFVIVVLTVNFTLTLI